MEKMPLDWLKTDVPTLKLGAEDTALFDEVISRPASECPLFSELLSKTPAWHTHGP